MVTTTSVGKPTLSSAGLGSGLDVKTIVKAMVDAESQPLNDLQALASQMKTRLSALGQVKSYVSAFRDAASALSRPATWNAVSAVSNNTSAVSVSSSSGAATGAYTVEVTQLAKAQTLASRAFAQAEALGAGTLTLEKTAGGSTPLNITVEATDTLAQVRDKINAADSGITAHIQTDASGSRLVLQSAKTGSAEGFKVTASGTGGVADLAYDPAATTNPMTQPQAGTNALATVNGVPVDSASNTLTNVLEGVTLTLGSITTTPATVTVTRDTTAIKASINAMATAYNSLQTFLASQTKYDPATKTAATLQGDSAANGIRNQLRQMMGATTTASASYTRLSEVGFDLQKDGTVVVSDAKLTAALADPTEVRKLFANSDAAVAGNNGVGVQLRKLADSMLGTDGVLTSRSTGIQNSITYNSRRQAEMQTRIDKYESRVQAQYNALDTKMSQLNSLSAYVTQQITQMNKSTA